MTTRPAAVAGTFYPADTTDLQHAVSTYMNEVPTAAPVSKAIIAPHAVTFIRRPWRRMPIDVSLASR